MARSLTKRAARPSSTNVQTLSIKVILDSDGAGEPYYVNFAEVAAGQYDAELVFGRVPAKPSPEIFAAAKTSQVITVPATVRIVMPHKVLMGLRDALNTQIEALEAREDERDNPARAN